MISSSLRHTQRHLQLRIGRRCLLPSCNKSIRNPRSRFISHHENNSCFTASNISNDNYIFQHVSKRRSYDAISGATARQIIIRQQSNSPTDQTNVDGSLQTQTLSLLISKTEDPPEYYSSPLYILSNRSMRSVHSKECDPIKIKNGTWYTAAYKTKYGTYYSGRFGDFTKKVNPMLAASEVMTLNNTNYYKSKEAAIEAAAGRVIDLYSYSLKKRYKSFREDDSVTPLRYCIEDPELDAVLEQEEASMESSLEKFSWQLHAPINFLENWFRVTYGATTGNCFQSKARALGDQKDWYTATFTDPIASEVFHSGLVGKINVKNKEGATLKPSLDEAEVKIDGGKVYYPNEQLAKHAAAARAIDCYMLRECNDSLMKKYQLCLESPYATAAERDEQNIDYDDLLIRRVAHEETPVHVSNILKDQPHSLHIPMYLLKLVRAIKDSDLRAERVDLDSISWHTATYTDPITSEVFHAGIGRQINAERKQGAFLSPSLDEVECRIVNGRVYYAQNRYAKHAAAARAIDCYLYRETGDISTNQLCLEGPYNYGHMQEIDYDALAATKANVSVVESFHPMSNEPVPSSNNSRAPQTPKGAKTFKSILETSLFQLHVPINLLEKSYKQVYGSMYPSESFECYSVTAMDKTWYTASFTNPETLEVFSSGLTRSIDVEERRGATLSPPLGEAEVHIMDGKVYYSEEKFARHAAAARAIDCYVFREGSDGLTRNYQLCLEDPYNDAVERDAQNIDYDDLLRQRPAPSKKSNVKSSVEESLWKLHIPLSFLKTYLSEKFDAEYSSLQQESVEIGNRMWHTATFTDPITSEHFHSGLVGPINAEKKEGMVLSPPMNEVEVRILDGKVYYGKNRYAKHAAAARAIDCYLYRDKNSIIDTSKYQLCLEDPYDEGDAKEVDYDTLVASRGNVQIQSNPEETMPFLEESDEDFTIVSRTYSDQPTRVDQKLSTLGRIAEIWAETPSNPSDSRKSNEMVSSKTASKVPTENILNWFKRVDHTPTNFEQAMAFSQLCNKTLLALAKENDEMIINSNTSCAECMELQNEAKSILDKLTSISSEFIPENESVVNANTLNAYIQCLSRIDVEDSAMLAESLLKRMSEGADNLPPPNTFTYNIVMKLWSLVDGEKGKTSVNDTFSHLQNAAVARDDLRPNKDTYQILLAANSKENNHFKYDLAVASLERINKLSQDLGGEPFTPDANDYIAAMKKTTIDTFVRDDNQPSWFWHGQEYDGGFKPISDDKKCEALDMEKWLEHAQEMGISPSEGMYYEVVKTWASTGSLEGLIGGDGAYGAEELAKKAVLRNEATPSVEMFSPIIAAWSLCGEKLGPDRVKEWIEQISLLGMEPDLRLKVAYFVAVEKWQSKLISNLLRNDGEINDHETENSTETISSDENVDSLFKAAQNCTRYLEESTLGKNIHNIDDLDAFTSMLRYNVKAWKRASESTLLLPDGYHLLDATQGVEEMKKLMKRVSLKNRSQDAGDVGEAQLNAAGKVYIEFISQLLNLDTIMDKQFEDNDKCYFADRIADVESSLRSFEFHSRRLATNDKLMPETNNTRHSLYRETLRGCAGVKLSSDYGHMLRLCTLIMDCLSWHHKLVGDHGSSKEAEDVTDMFCDIAIISGTCVKNPYERMNVLRSIYDRASDFFAKKNPHHESSYARVDRAALLGSMRRSLGDDSEITDSFLSSFEEEKQGRRRRARQRG